MITEPKIVNSGAPQGAFLKRQMVIKQDGSQMPFEPTDFRVGLDIGICGRSIRVYDCDGYTREFFNVSTAFLVTDVYRTLARANLKLRPAQRTTSLSPRSQSHQRRTQSSSSSLRRSSVEEESHPRSSSLITIERCSDSSLSPRISSSSGTTSWLMTPLRSERSTSQMTAETPSQYTLGGRSSQRPLLSTSQDSNSSEIDILPVTRSNSIESLLPTAECSASRVSTSSLKTTS